MVTAARRAGLQGIAFTEHAEWYEEDEAYGYWQLEPYFSELAALRSADGFVVLAGAELGNPHEFPDEVRAFLAAWPWDYVIGSVHWLDGLPGWTAPIFLENGVEATYEDYFAEVLRMVQEADFDVLGHIDLVRRDSWELVGEVLSVESYEGYIRQILRCVVERGRGLEINTSGVRKGLPGPLPDLRILKWYREAGGEVLVFGSDAHQPADVGDAFAVARGIALEAGFAHLARFAGRRVIGWERL